MIEPKWHPNSLIAQTLWRHIEQHPGCAVCDLLEWTGYPRQNIDKSLRRMLKRELIHISGYQLYQSTHAGMARQFSVGPGPELPKPTIPRREQLAKARARNRENKRRAIIGKAGAQGGALAAMVAQLRLTT